MNFPEYNSTGGAGNGQLGGAGEAGKTGKTGKTDVTQTYYKPSDREMLLLAYGALIMTEAGQVVRIVAQHLGLESVE